MAFDGITVAGLCKELQDTIGGGRIYKIAQTDKNELVITIRPPAERGPVGSGPGGLRAGGIGNRLRQRCPGC